MKQNDLLKVFVEAIKNNSKYIAVFISIKDKEPEIIINSKVNFYDKLEYYINNYNNELMLNNNNDVKIVKAIHFNDFKEIGD